MILSTHHVALGLDDRERIEAIHGAYRDLARRYHPARVGPGGEENFRLVDAAYRVLSDSSLRRFYASAREEHQDASAPAAARARPLRAHSLSLDRAAILGSPNGDAMLARFARNFSGIGVPKSESAQCLRIRFIIAARDRVAGTLFHLGLPVLALCEACAGHGATGLLQCRTCDGRGLVDAERTLALRVSPAPSDAPNELSLAPLGIHNFYLQAIVHVDSTLN